MNTMWLDVWRFHSLALLCGCVLDWIQGDPEWFPHPVRLMGRMISFLERRLRARMKGREKSGGLVLVFIMCLTWWAAPWAAFTGLRLVLPSKLHIVLFAAEAFVCCQMMAARSLWGESMKVGRLLENGDVEGARGQVSMIVGRDTAMLDREGIIRAAVETVAENASDGVAAPFFYMALLGPAGGTLYKAINTMDSMIGYDNEKYALFGRAAAKLDDAANFIPARITGVLICAAAFLLPGIDGRRAWSIFLRDRRKHASPNSAHGEAACAGALGLGLAGDAWYAGVLHKKPFIGDEFRAIEPEDIRRANLLMLTSEGFLMSLLALLIVIL